LVKSPKAGSTKKKKGEGLGSADGGEMTFPTQGVNGGGRKK